tara:strand:- start:226 stop:1617 length:1392 start_codon:yes stop_codon:yes gene_type:complete
MPITLEVGYFNSFYMKRLADLPIGEGKTGGTNYTTPTTTVVEEDWYVEESRIRGGYNNTSTDLGVKAYIVEDNDAQQRRANSLIYSGIFNSRTGVNQSNQFSVAEEITRSVDPANGSIQKLYAEDTNLIIFQEDKVNRALIDKDAIYSAEGSAITTTANLVIGQIIAYAGEFGISTNPESFAVYGYQKYFVDRNRNAVLRLSMDGITEISNYGMVDFFRDKLSIVNSTGEIVGAYDIHNKNYVISLQDSDGDYNTLSFDEATNGWVSFFDYKPSNGFSSQGGFFTTNGTSVWKHYSTSVYRANFYGVNNDATIKFVLNPDPTRVKTFKTINYEGTNGWEVTSLVSDSTGFDATDSGWGETIDTATVPITDPPTPNTYTKIWSYDEGLYVENNVQYRAGFDRKQNRYVAAIKNNSTIPLAGQVLIGPNNTGIKAYYATVTMKTDATTDPGGLKELFAVGSIYGR